MQASQAHSTDEIGIRVPPPLAGDAALRDLVHRLAESLRAEAVPLARRETDRAPETKLETLLTLMKVLVFGRADALVEEVLESDATVACAPGIIERWLAGERVFAAVPATKRTDHEQF
jgi:hypothetical protein